MGEGDCFFMKINSKGEQFWNRQFGTEKNDGVKAIVFNGKVSDQIIISGLQNLPPAHAYIRMYLKDGSLQWEKNIVPDGSGFDASGKDVTLDNQGNIVHLGLTASDLFAPSIGGPDFYIVKMRLENTYWRH
jgi:hypothetical protein